MQFVRSGTASFHPSAPLDMWRCSLLHVGADSPQGDPFNYGGRVSGTLV